MDFLIQIVQKMASQQKRNMEEINGRFDEIRSLMIGKKEVVSRDLEEKEKNLYVNDLPDLTNILNKIQSIQEKNQDLDEKVHKKMREVGAFEFKKDWMNAKLGEFRPKTSDLLQLA